MDYTAEKFLNNCRHREIIEELRKILLSIKELSEEIKWGKPTFVFKNANIAVLQDFKNYAAILLPKGVLLKDKEYKLVTMTENTFFARQLRFKSKTEVLESEDCIIRYINESIKYEINGVPLPNNPKYDEIFPLEFKQALEKDSLMSDAFNNLTSGRKNGHMLYIESAKRKETRLKRIEMMREKILMGKGPNENLD